MAKFAVICASNQNRSMAAHLELSKNNFNVKSYGTGKEVRLPGPAPNRPNVYSFGTPYDKMYTELSEKDPELYKTNGVLDMLDRNRNIKTAPERWHEELEDMFDVVITCEERCFDSVCEDLLARGQKRNRIVHVINCNIRDNFQEAATGGKWILELATMIEESQDIDEDIENILQQFSKKNPKCPILYNAIYY